MRNIAQISNLQIYLTSPPQSLDRNMGMGKMAKFEHHTYARNFVRDRKESEWTRWFKAYTRPVLEGWYHVYSSDVRHCARYWNGTAWMLCKGRNKESDISSFQNWEWRGLKVNPETTIDN
jgi:hypothetical protein